MVVIVHSFALVACPPGFVTSVQSAEADTMDSATRIHVKTPAHMPLPALWVVMFTDS
jgi:hypothetical protein